jgi:epoxyqueuosine reductase
MSLKEPPATPAAAPSIEERVREKSRALGFDVTAFARADLPLDVEHARYRAFLDQGMHGAMGYLADDVEVRRRLDSDDILAGARTVICVGRRYHRGPEAERADPPLAQGMARYARGQDYHVFIRKRLRQLAAFVRTLGPGVEARPLCDIAPVLERAWAARAGLGFVGKNGLVITPGQGSYQLLGEVVTTLSLAPGTPMNERCGECTRCLDACPTQAFPAPFVLDARRCIAYLTIEQPAAPPDDLREAIGEQLFGCDICQEVCPWNKTAPASAESTAPFRPRERWSALGLDDLVAMDEPRWEELALGSPLRRAGRAGVARNAVIVAENRLRRDPGDEQARRAVALAEEHDDPMVRALAGARGSKMSSPRS